MTVIATEKIESRRLFASRDGKRSTYELVYNVRGTNSVAAAKIAVNDATPKTKYIKPNLFYKQAVTVEVVGHNLWLARVQYDTSGPEPLSADDSFEFSTLGGQRNITHSLTTVASYPSGAPDYQGAIGVSDSGVEGADVFVSNTTFTETHFFEELTPAYKGTLIQTSSKVNNATFRGLAAGEVLFLGAVARKLDNREDTPWSVTYEFAVELNRTSFSVGSISVSSKKGWEYMWVRYGAVDDTASDTLLQVPSAVYIERVYEEANFAVLGIGI